MSARIHCLSTDETLLGSLATTLRRAGFELGIGGELPSTPEADVVVVDTRLPAATSVVEGLRATRDAAAILALGAATELRGADAQLALPADPEALLLSVRALVRLRRAAPEAREIARRWPRSLDALRDGVCIRDESGVVLRCNPAFAAALGSSRIATTGQRILLEDLFHGVPVPGDVDVRGHWYRTELDIVVDAAGKPVASVLVLAELEERTREEHERERRLREARALQHARDEFLSIASHELRTPLTTLQLQVQGLQRRLATCGRLVEREMVEERLDATERQVRRLVRLVEELLDAGKLDAAQLELHPTETDLVALAGEVVQRHTEALARSGSVARILAAGTVIGWWDASRVDQVLANLLSNAIQYGRGRPIEIAISAHEGRAVLDVRDEGIGIAPEDQERIFGRFERAVRDFCRPGFGVGLWSVRRILHAMGGRVRVHSIPDVGSTFTVELPLAPAALARERA